jgi:hypothetical protein
MVALYIEKTFQQKGGFVYIKEFSEARLQVANP